MIYENGEQRWNDMDRGIVHQSSLAILPKESSGSKQEERVKE
jgi:hypothetical protein